MGETDNKVDCGLGCLIERHWHAILVGALISLAGLLGAPAPEAVRSMRAFDTLHSVCKGV